jgi:pyruvate, water dikinase
MSALKIILSLLSFTALCMGAADGEFRITRAERDSRGRVTVTVQGEAGYYYRLLRGPQPGDCTFPAALSSGGTGEVMLTDSVPLLSSAFYQVQRVVWTAPLDSDGDGISDTSELQSVQANPLNAARNNIAISDGANIARSEEAFYALSHRDNFPGAPNVREVKFLIMAANTANPQLYFLNVTRHQYHYDFARNVLGYTGSLTTFNNETYFNNTARKQIAGSLVVHESWQPPAGGPPGVVTMEFWPSDAVSYAFVQKAYDLISRALPFLRMRLAYHAASQTQRTLYKTELAQYTSARRDRLHLITTEELYGQSTYSLLNPGTGFGLLKVYDGTAPMTVRDVIIFRSLPNEITRTAGIITEAPQTPLSHVNLKAKQNDTPNAYIKNALSDPRISTLLGKYVRFEPLADGFEIREATLAEVDQHLEALRPTQPQFPVRDLSKKTILPLSSLGFTSAGAFGAKTANVAELRKFLPSSMVPNGHGIPFYFYDEFMKANGFYDVAQSMMADPLFSLDASYRENALSQFRELIRNGSVPLWMETALTTLQNSFTPGTPIRCRSSTNNEDLAGFSGAGLYDSYTHRPDEGHLGKTTKQVWASLWTSRAFDERDFYRVDHYTAAMGILVTQNFDDEIANGVAVTKNIIDPNWTGYYVNAQAGESLVTNPNPSDIPEEFLIARLLGNTRYTIQYVTFSNLVPEGQTVITTAQAELLADYMASIQNRFAGLYGGSSDFAMEIEWKITSTGQLIIKQARPWVE